MPAEDEQEDEDKELTDDEKAEKQFNEMVGMADKSIDRFNAEAPSEVRDAAIAEFIETGNLNPETAQVNEVETAMVHAAFEAHAERNVFKPLGLTQDQYNSYVSAEDAVTLRQALVAGDWGTLYRHAQAVAAHIAENGDSNHGLY